MYDQPQTVRAFLDGGAISFIPHIVLRGTYIPDTARCTSGNPLHTPSYVEPGYFQHSILFQCFTDMRVNGYILGEGPDRLTVQVSFLSYWDGYYARAAADEGMTEQELIEDFLEAFVVILEEGYGRTGEGIYGREVILFIGPGSSHATEVWQVYETWDVQRQEDDTIVAIHPHRDGWRAARPDDYQTYRSQLEMGLPAFTQAVTTANQARVTEYGGRIAPEDIQSRAEGVDLPMLVTDANRLRQFYTDTGAYNHPDGPPAQPPPPCGLAVPDQADNPGLMRDCITLLGLKDSLRGTAALNWGVNAAIATWNGVNIGGIPSQVTKLLLPTKSLSGSIPSALGQLSELTQLDLSRNSLTGEIPGELGGLSNLEVLRLSGNSFTGCIPMALISVATNDLSSLGLPECVEGGPVPAPEGVSVTLSAGTFTITWSAVAGSARYEAQQRIGTTGDNWVSVGATTVATLSFTPSGGPECGTTYQFRVRAFGDGIMHTADWGAESDAESVATEACNIAPQFVAAPYSFSIAENATTTALVGTVSATDDDSDTVMYTITNGNSDGKFSLGDLSGEVTVADVLDYETISSYTLTVEASDGRGGTATTTVAITVSDVAEDPPPAPSGLSVSLADGAFTISWTAMAGAARYEVQHREEGSGDDWTVEGTSTSASLTYTPEDAPDCGTTHEFRMRAFGDGETYVATWGAESASESVATEECDRAPTFGSTHYSFSIAEDAATSTSVGTVSATDEDGDTLTYEIAGGDPDGKFSIGSGTGSITLAGEVDSDVLAFYSLEVEADDGNDNTATTTVGVSLLLSECSNGTVVPRPRSNPWLVRDCSMLLAGRDTLAGTGSLDWSANTRINDWQGVTVHPTPSPYVRVLLLTEQGLTGSIPPELGGVADVRRIDLDYNTLSGGIPRELGNLPDLELLYLTDNQLTGSIPPEMGNLRNLKTLYLSDNNLTGALPSELGRLRRLTQLTIEDNSLTGAIPPVLGDLSNLRSLYLSANMLTGGIPPELGKLSKLTQLLLERNSLGGEIPSQLGSLTRLEHVYLRNNGLTGAIPAEWGELANLTRLYLSSGNNLTGCIPSGLRDVEDNDLDRLGLEYCGSSGQ